MPVKKVQNLLGKNPKRKPSKVANNGEFVDWLEEEKKDKKKRSSKLSDLVSELKGKYS